MIVFFLFKQAHFTTRTLKCQGLWLLSQEYLRAQTLECQGLWLLSQRLMVPVSFLLVVVVVVVSFTVCLVARPRSGG